MSDINEQYINAIQFLHDNPMALRKFYIENIGFDMFNMFVSVGCLTSNLGKVYHITRLLDDTYQDLIGQFLGETVN